MGADHRDHRAAPRRHDDKSQRRRPWHAEALRHGMREPLGGGGRKGEGGGPDMLPSQVSRKHEYKGEK